MVDKVRENRLRRMAKRLGLKLRKSRVRNIHLDDFGEYQLVHLIDNYLVAGQRWDLELDDVEVRLDRTEAQLVKGREVPPPAAPPSTQSEITV